MLVTARRGDGVLSRIKRWLRPAHIDVERQDELDAAQQATDRACHDAQRDADVIARETAMRQAELAAAVRRIAQRLAADD